MTTGRPRTDFDSELRFYNDVLREACDVGAREQVLDIGCGTGQTTRQAATAARDGSALGVDVSVPAIERARQLAADAGLHNAVFEQGDAQNHPFAAARFDLALSRFGTMFFADPGVAFSAIGRAVRPGGRLVLLVWQSYDRNDWIAAVDRALAASGAPPASARPRLDPFSLGDPAFVTALMQHAGCTDVAYTDVREPVDYGVDVDAALDWISGFTCVRDAIDGAPDTGDRVREHLRELLAAHADTDGVRFESRAWLVTARRE